MANMPGPPPPPPVPIRQGPPPPPPGARLGPPPPRPPPMFMQGPPRQSVNSTKVVDITPRQPMDEKHCRKLLTSYHLYTIKKAVLVDSKTKPTWARSEVVEEKLAQGDISKEIKKLNELRGRTVTVAEKKAALAPFQQGQITHLLDDLATKEEDESYEWSLVQLDKREQTIKHTGKRETTTMTVYIVRAPRDGLNPCHLHQQKMERLQREREERDRPPGPPPGEGPPMINLGPKGPKVEKGRNKKYHDEGSSISSGYDSDTASDSEPSSSNNTTISSKSRGPRRYSYHRSHTRSHSRHREPREHRKRYYIEDRAHSPHRRYSEYDPGPMSPMSPVFSQPVYAPEVPRNASGFDSVAQAAAYQAGKIDGDAERFGSTERERYAAPPRQVIVERTVPIIVQREREPRAIVTYDRFADSRFSDPLPLSPRYVEERYVEEPIREYRPRGDYTRREREAEEYMERPYVERRVPMFTNRHPFAPVPLRRSYPSSDESRW